MMKIIMALAFLLGFSVKTVHAATAANVNLAVTIGNTLAITIGTGQSSIGFPSLNLGAALTLITQPVVITNATNSIIADLSLSAATWQGDGAGETVAMSGFYNSAVPEGQDAASLIGVFVSAGNAPAGVKGMYDITTANLIDASSSTSVTTSAVEAKGTGTLGTLGQCVGTDLFCPNGVSTDRYSGQTVGPTTYYIGDGQNLTLGETVSLVLFFRPPTTLTFETSSLTTALAIVASAGGSEE